MGENTQNDPQPTIWYLMRPQEGFEDIYQGRSVNLPIPLFWYTGNGALPLESERLRSGYESHLAAYLQVARGATAMLIFPRIQGIAGDHEPPVVVDYTYQLRWRQRPLEDTILSKALKRHSVPNVVSAFSSTRRLVIPCSQGEVITPQYPTGGRIARGLFTTNGMKVFDQQGVYDDAFYLALDAGQPGYADNALGATCYPVQYQRCDGDELGLVLFRDEQLGATWDFSGITAADWALTCTYGTSNGQRPINPGAAVYVANVARATTP